MKLLPKQNEGNFTFTKKKVLKNRFTLIADWHFFRGIIQPEEELNFDDLKKGFLWSQKKGFIEEDSSIISTMIARGKKLV